MATIKVLTYNIRHGRGMDDRVDLSRIADVLTASGADIICLQEVDKGLPRSGMIHQAEALAECLDFEYAFHANFGIPVAGMGNAILSRFPIYSTWNTPLPFTGEPRGILHAVINGLQGQIHAYSTHWGLDKAQRLRQAQASAFRIRTVRRSHPAFAICCGDLNAPPDSPEVEDVIWQSELRDCGPVHALTYATDALSAKIDYILASANSQVRSAEVLYSVASDHLPVLVTLDIIEPHVTS